MAPKQDKVSIINPVEKKPLRSSSRTIMAPKKVEVSRISRIKKNPRRSSWRKRNLRKVTREDSKRLLAEMAAVGAEMAEVRAENNSVKEMILTGLDDHRSDIARMSEVLRHVRTLNNCTLESVNRLATIIIGLGPVP
ncbi:uncharacterized protein LOC120005778 isoform X4 [Tripterygium wilfordii]|uniref:uncharacterized protein LOC120005778 isoform X4 n=1 Tax=Tripterygium wilfordii TaxID=458696 RepID=UPI0018F804B7|nr:uncharacterized protein LOC120005778 isoform X4 [Tripterygium wilfordii]